MILSLLNYGKRIKQAFTPQLFVLYLSTLECFMVSIHRKRKDLSLSTSSSKKNICRAAAVQLLDENYVCDQIVDGVRNNTRMVMLPPHTVLFYMLKG